MALFEIKQDKVIDIKGIKFNRFDINDKIEFDTINHTLKFDEITYEHSFEYLLTYALTLDISKTELIWKKVKGFLMVFTYVKKTERIELFVTPVSNNNDNLKEAMETLVKIFNKINGVNNISYVTMFTNKMFDKIISKEYLKTNGIKIQSSMSDFVFKSDDLIKLEGKKFKSRRNKINKLKKEYPNTNIRYMNDEDVDGIFRVRELWCKDRFKDIKDVWDYHIFNILIRYRKELELRITVATIDDVIQGFCIISKLGDNCMCVLKECTDVKYIGLSEYLWYESVRLSRDLGEYENDGNGGHKKDGLYLYKLDHNPILLLDKKTFAFNSKGEKISNDIFKWEDKNE